MEDQNEEMRAIYRERDAALRKEASEAYWDVERLEDEFIYFPKRITEVCLAGREEEVTLLLRRYELLPLAITGARIRQGKAGYEHARLRLSALDNGFPFPGWADREKLQTWCEIEWGHLKEHCQEGMSALKRSLAIGPSDSILEDSLMMLHFTRWVNLQEDTMHRLGADKPMTHEAGPAPFASESPEVG